MADAHTEAVVESRWGGGGGPHPGGAEEVGVGAFFVSRSLTFSALLCAYGYVRLASDDWPTPFHFSPAIIYASIMTFFLLSSSLTMVMAVSNAHRQQHRRTVFWLLCTMAGRGRVFG